MNGRTSLSIVAAIMVFSAGAFLLMEVRFDSFREFNPTDADIKNDWVVATALVNGDNPYRDLDELAADYSQGSYEAPPVPLGSPLPKRTPRTPGAVLLGVPLTPVSVDALPRLTNLITIAAMAAMFGVVAFVTRRILPMAILLPTLFTAPLYWQLRFSNVSVLVALLVFTAGFLLRNRDSVWGGVALGLAITLKIYPGLLIAIPIAHRRRKALFSTFGVTVVLNTTPLLLDSVSFTEAADAILNAANRFGDFGGNASITQYLTDLTNPNVSLLFLMAISVGATLWVIKRPTDLMTDLFFLGVLAALVTPLAWPHYFIVAFPLFAWTALYQKPGRSFQLLGAIALALTLAPLKVPYTALGMVLLTALVAHLRLQTQRSEHAVDSGRAVEL